jgi:hypothetical protein
MCYVASTAMGERNPVLSRSLQVFITEVPELEEPEDF